MRRLCLQSTFIFYRGVSNAASYIPAGLPNGQIARGSLFTVLGRAMWPAEGVRFSAFPLAAALAGVSVEVCQEACVAAIPVDIMLLVYAVGAGNYEH
jgi:hypothetical protein